MKKTAISLLIGLICTPLLAQTTPVAADTAVATPPHATTAANNNVTQQLAARVVYLTGEVRIAQKEASNGQDVHTGDQLETGKDGYLYIKTVDNGFLVLRPKTVAVIRNYHIDGKNPKNTRIKIELLSGVSRHISGSAVKAARQNFRFNTPVAAIGVRGTDFTVFTSEHESHISVTNGGVAISPFNAHCSASAFGACEGATVRELFAQQKNAMVEVKRGDELPRLLENVSSERSDTLVPTLDENNRLQDNGLSPLKSSELDNKKQNILEPEVALPSTVQWGRWQTVLDQESNIDINHRDSSKTDFIAYNAFYAILRDRGTWQRPTNNLSFQLNSAEAVVRDQRKVLTPAAITDGNLTVDIAANRFATALTLVHNEVAYPLRSFGNLTGDGRISSDPSTLGGNNMQVNGALGLNNSEAAYVFQSQLSKTLQAYGLTHWQVKP